MMYNLRSVNHHFSFLTGNQSKSNRIINKDMNIEKPKNVFVALAFSFIAWVVMQFLRPPRNDQSTIKNG